MGTIFYLHIHATRGGELIGVIRWVIIIIIAIHVVIIGKGGAVRIVL